jgi:hypothetical protein
MNALGCLSLMMKHWSVATRTCLDCNLIAQKGHCGERGRREMVSGVRVSDRWSECVLEISKNWRCRSVIG